MNIALWAQAHSGFVLTLSLMAVAVLVAVVIYVIVRLLRHRAAH